MTMLFDTVDASDVRRTKDGYLVAEAKVARTGIQLYSAGELGMDGDPNRIVKVYRPPEEVFAADAMASYAHRPVTDNHPADLVSADNWKEHAKGQTGDEVLRDKEFVRVPLLLMDAAAIASYEAGKRQLSMGYTMDLDTTAGTTDDGEQYDAVQRNLRMNHLALVSRARGGSDLRLGDRNLEDTSMQLKTITVDGLAVETTEPGAQAISKLLTDMDALRTAQTDAAETHKQELAAKDAELAKKDAELDSLKDQILSDEDLDQRVNDRADLIATAKTIADKDYAGLSDEAIRATAVIAKLGAKVVDGKSADYIQARFDILAEDASEDPVRKSMRNAPTPATDDAEAAHNTMVSDMQNAWRGNNKEVA